MVFSSIPFLFFFLPACLILYYLVPYKVKNYVLLAFSLIFYAWGEPVYIVLMLFASAVDYTNGLLMERFGTSAGRRKLFLCASVVINLSMLGFFKYADFLVETVSALLHLSIKPLGLGLPVGISFFTFQTMSYSVDLYRRNVKVEKNYFTYLTYVSMFPQLIAGPIVRFSTVNEELHSRHIGWNDFVQGTLRFVQGLFKKVLIANNVGALWETIRAAQAGAVSAGGISTESVSVVTAWLGALCFTLQLYFDFSAYSDMAIGMGRMLGFHFPENFLYPLSSVSVTDFWRRWHISLSTWFRDYVYIPLGGNRAGTARHLRNMFVVWFLTGLWHGAAWNFVLWGLYYGVLLTLEKYVWGEKLDRLPKWLRHLYAILIVVFGFVIFVFDDMGQLGGYLSLMFGAGGNALFGTELIWYVKNYAPLLLTAVLLAFPLYPYLKKKVESLPQWGRTVLSLGAAVGYAGLFILTTAYLVNDTYNPFLYFRF